MKRLAIYLLVVVSAQALLYTAAAALPAWRLTLLHFDPRVGLSALASLVAPDAFRAPAVWLASGLIAWIAVSLIVSPDRRTLLNYVLTEATLTAPSVVVIVMAYLGNVSRSAAFWRGEVIAPVLAVTVYSFVPAAWALALYVKGGVPRRQRDRPTAMTVAV